MYIMAQDRAKPGSAAYDLYSIFEVEESPVFGEVDGVVVDTAFESKTLIEEVTELREKLMHLEAVAFRELKTTKIPAEKAVCRWIICHVGALREMTEPFDGKSSLLGLDKILKWRR